MVDEIHNLNHHTKVGADASDHLKYLAENVAATFVYAGIDVTGNGMFTGVRGRQLAGRFVPILTKPFAYSTIEDRNRWRQLVDGFEQMLRLREQEPGALTRLSPHLYAQTAGSISALSMMIRSAAITAILDGTEHITQADLDAIPLDHAAATARTTAKKASSRRKNSSGAA